VQVADEGDVGTGADAEVHRCCLAAQMRDARAKQRVGEHAHSAHFDQDGGVAEENNTVSRRALGTGHGRVIGHG